MSTEPVLNIQIEEVVAKPHKLKSFETAPVPSVIERLGALQDPGLKAKNEEADRINAKWDEAVKDLRNLWGPY